MAILHEAPLLALGLGSSLADADYEVLWPKSCAELLLYAASSEKKSLAAAVISARRLRQLRDRHGKRCVAVPMVATIRDEGAESSLNALDDGALSVVPESADPAILVRTVEAATDGFAQLPVDVVEHVRRGQAYRSELRLDEEQTTILQSLAEGTTAADLGQRLGYSRRELHRRMDAVYRLLGVQNRSQAIAVAGREGIVDIERV